jgi:flagellar basal-body rod modification protein FlgD
MTVAEILAANSAPAVVDASEVGFAGLTSETFLKLLIAQLQNQDPTDPLDSDQLLSQISEMRNLQASIELQSALDNLVLSQQLTGATAFIGKTITALVGDQQIEVEGVVERVQMRDGKAFLSVDGTEVELGDVVSVAA